jgi:dCMP deaminase
MECVDPVSSRKNEMNWDDYFLGICDAVSKKSKDWNTQLGAVIVNQRQRIVGTGYNSFPSGVNDNIPERQKRPTKYKWFEHAERNAIYNAVADVSNGTMYCQWLPCPDCARAIIQVGIQRLVVSSFEIPKRWLGDIRVSVQMLKEARVAICLPNEDSAIYGEILD